MMGAQEKPKGMSQEAYKEWERRRKDMIAILAKDAEELLPRCDEILEEMSLSSGPLITELATTYVALYMKGIREPLLRLVIVATQAAGMIGTMIGKDLDDLDKMKMIMMFKDMPDMMA